MLPVHHFDALVAVVAPEEPILALHQISQVPPSLKAYVQIHRKGIMDDTIMQKFDKKRIILKNLLWVAVFLARNKSIQFWNYLGTVRSS